MHIFTLLTNFIFSSYLVIFSSLPEPYIPFRRCVVLSMSASNVTAMEVDGDQTKTTNEDVVVVILPPIQTVATVVRCHRCGSVTHYHSLCNAEFHEITGLPLPEYKSVTSVFTGVFNRAVPPPPPQRTKVTANGQIKQTAAYSIPVKDWPEHEK